MAVVEYKGVKVFRNSDILPVAGGTTKHGIFPLLIGMLVPKQDGDPEVKTSEPHWIALARHIEERRQRKEGDGGNGGGGDGGGNDEGGGGDDGGGDGGGNDQGGGGGNKPDQNSQGSNSKRKYDERSETGDGGGGGDSAGTDSNGETGHASKRRKTEHETMLVTSWQDTLKGSIVVRRCIYSQRGAAHILNLM